MEYTLGEIKMLYLIRATNERIFWENHDHQRPERTHQIEEKKNVEKYR